MIAIAFVLAAAAGTLVRATASPVGATFDRHVWTTFGLNVGGSFLAGWLHGAGADTAVIIGVGGLGSLTTFSTFIWQAERLANNEGTRPRAVGFVALTLTAGLAAAAIGYVL